MRIRYHGLVSPGKAGAFATISILALLLDGLGARPEQSTLKLGSSKGT